MSQFFPALRVSQKDLGGRTPGQVLGDLAEGFDPFVTFVFCWSKLVCGQIPQRRFQTQEEVIDQFSVPYSFWLQVPIVASR